MTTPAVGVLDSSRLAATSFGMSKIDKSPKTAIVLMNLGGPDQMSSVYPFLLNLFMDPAILRVPFFIRPLLARIIAGARKKPASENYKLLGGKSPLLELTIEQADALEAALGDLNVKCFIAMRYWHPFSEEAAAAVKAWDPDEVILLPLYPQHSTTTTGSSFTAWREAAAAVGLAKPTRSICCYHSDPGFVASTAAIVRASYEKARAELDPAIPLRVLFSAHGLPESIIKAGDPYQHQVERTTSAILHQMALPDLDSLVCYQSRATPQKWIGPSTEDEIERAGHDKTALLIVPIAFVSEHSETLVELDVEYREVAEHAGVPGYFRVPAQNSDVGFIGALADLVRRSMGRSTGLCSFAGSRTCYKPHSDCPHARAGAAAPPGPGEAKVEPTKLPRAA
jgi:ferrochelatase